MVLSAGTYWPTGGRGGGARGEMPPEFGEAKCHVNTWLTANGRARGAPRVSINEGLLLNDGLRHPYFHRVEGVVPASRTEDMWDSLTARLECFRNTVILCLCEGRVPYGRIAVGRVDCLQSAISDHRTVRDPTAVKAVLLGGSPYRRHEHRGDPRW